MRTESIGHLGGKAWQERDLAKNSKEEVADTVVAVERE